MNLGFSLSLTAPRGGGSSAPLLALDSGTVTATARQNPPPMLSQDSGTVTAVART